MTPTSRAHLTCLCGAVEEPGSLLKEENFPLPTDICFCNQCRLTSGALWTVGDKLRDAPASLSKCTGYKSSVNVTRYFCRTCGSSIFTQLQSGEYFVTGGCIEQSPDSKARGEAWPTDIMKVDFLGYAGDTTDYKHVKLLMNVDGKDVPVYDQGPQQAPVPRDEVLKRINSPASTSDSNAAEVLTAECYCGGVSLRVHRPDWGTDEVLRWKPAELPEGKYVAGFCVCRSCRLGIGSTGICPWTFVPPERIFTADGQPVEFGLAKSSNVSGLQDYTSTADEVKRSFCKTCGATFFYWAEDRPQVVDIAVGVLRAPEGTAADNWLWWRSRVSYEEETLDRQIVDSLKRNAPKPGLFEQKS